MIVGIFGQSGSGKTVVAEYFKKLGWVSINGDLVARQVLEIGSIGLKKVIEAFGEQYINQDGSLDRAKLGRLVFSDKNELDKLNSITKPLIENAIIEMINENKSKNIIIDGAILRDTSIIDLCNKTILIKSNKNVERIIKRDNLTEKDAKNRLRQQKRDEKSDIIIENNNTLEELYKKIKDVIYDLGV
jgi:dephospho-CoA kinase